VEKIRRTLYTIPPQESITLLSTFLPNPQTFKLSHFQTFTLSLFIAAPIYAILAP
jgi:hypothetical protein